MPKFQVGDAVTVARSSKNNPWVPSMDKICIGKTVVITGISLPNPPTKPSISYLADDMFYYPEDCLELVAPLPATPSDAAPIDWQNDPYKRTGEAEAFDSPAEESEAARRYREKLEFRRAIGRIS